MTVPGASVSVTVRPGSVMVTFAVLVACIVMVVSGSSGVDNVVFAAGEDTSASIGVVDTPVVSEASLGDTVEERLANSVDTQRRLSSIFQFATSGISNEVCVLVAVGLSDDVADLKGVGGLDDTDAFVEVGVSEEVSTLVTVTVLEFFDKSSGVDVLEGVNIVVNSDFLDGIVVAVVAFHQIVVVVVQQPSQSSAAAVEALALTEALRVTTLKDSPSGELFVALCDVTVEVGDFVADDVSLVLLSEVGEDVFFEKKVEECDEIEDEVDGVTTLSTGESFLDVLLLILDGD
ncbi:uncharacterized protein N7484_003929 [Penicillium longicatenatum]|uniref:uncharacterized protein n=1 Tax=Penicillium longicatenatum TaxID=1561947 RepID=UPI002547B0FD|nr:uncharacterized protein N7484_003929 [Penicillium longicatenatum]KAJ5650206.1 hypothetical protein N7484_003929 [Penicillium longicatenatum]